MTLPDIVLALVGALVLHLTVEGPITSVILQFGPKNMKTRQHHDDVGKTGKSGTTMSPRPKFQN